MVAAVAGARMIGGGCPVPATGGQFLSGVIGFIDCQAQNLGAGGYQALAMPGSSAALIVTGLLTLFVALFGIRLLLGQTPDLRDGVVAAAKIGIVLLIASSWPAYRTLVYDLTMRGPAEIVAAIGQPASLPGAGGGLTYRLQGADDGIVALGQLGTGQNQIVEAAPQPGQPVPPPPPTKVGLADDLSFGLARLAFLGGTLGTLAIVRLMAGLLLALAPLFAGLLLFEPTRGLFAGWVRALAGAIIAAVGVTVVLGVELALLEPWLNDALMRRSGQEAIYAAPTELLAMTSAFAIALFGVLAYALRMAFTVHIPSFERVAAGLPGQSAAPAAMFGDRALADSTAGPPTRAFAIADAVAAVQRREVALATAAAGGRSNGSSASTSHERQSGVTSALRDRTAPGVAAAPVPLGQSFRRTRSRVSSGAARRDGRA